MKKYDRIATEKLIIESFQDNLRKLENRTKIVEGKIEGGNFIDYDFKRVGEQIKELVIKY